MGIIKVNAPFVGEDEIQAVSEVIKSGMLAHGSVVEKFEREFAKYLGVPYLLTVSNGTIALYVTLKALGVGRNDEVIVPDFTFFATASTVVLAGATPVFADIDLETYTLNPASVEELITDRTKAIVVVHLYGHPAKMDEILRIAREHGLYVIEDCAQSHGAEYRGVKTGSIGDIGAFSFYATKNLTMGEGGAISTKSKDVADFVRLYRNHGQRKRYYHEVIGWNFRITNIQAAIGLQQLRKLDQMNSRRREIARLYRDELSSIKSLRLPVEKLWAKHVYHQFTVWVEGDGARDRLAEYLREHGVQVGIHYPRPLHAQPALRKYFRTPCPNAENASTHVLSLPMHPGLSDEDVLTVTKLVKEYFKST